MKTLKAITEDVRRRLGARWHTDLVGGESAFPHAFPLGRPSAAALLNDYATVHVWTVALQDWSARTGVKLEYENRAAQGRTVQPVPTHANVESIDQAATIAGGDWATRLKRTRARLPILRERYPNRIDTARALRLVDMYLVVDFELLLTVADWYLQAPERALLGVTPRQVPLPGVHAKWLQSHKAGVLALTGLTSFNLLPEHAARIHFTYLDPDYRATGARIHDSATVGDTFAPAYTPEVVVISENKDTAIHFPPLAGAISVEGVGKGGKTVASFPWIRDAPVVVYWGDIDRDGYEILDGYRVDFGRDIDSILMDSEAYDEYEQFGTDVDKNGKPIAAGIPKPVKRLNEHERALYLRLLDVEHTGHRRLEQERIPLASARESVQRILES